MSESPTFLSETRGWNVPGLSDSGMFVADVDRPERRHMCGRCRNPFTRSGNPECPNAPRWDEPLEAVDRDMDAYQEWELERFEAELDRQGGFEW